MKVLLLILSLCYIVAKPASAGCFCAMVYEPVVGSDGKTYSNACEAQCSGAGAKADVGDRNQFGYNPKGNWGNHK